MPTPNSDDRPKAAATDCAPTRKYAANSTAPEGPRILTGPAGERDPFRFLLDELAARGVTVVLVCDEDELDAEGVTR